MKIDKNLYSKIQKYTSTDYEPFMRGDTTDLLIDNDGVLAIIEDLLIELSMKEEELEDLKNDINENYIALKYNPYDEYGVNENDF